MTIFLLIVIILELGGLAYLLWYSFFIPEQERRRAFDKLTAEEIEELKNTMTADHFFRLSGQAKLPSLKLKITRKKKVE
jgi:arginine exporter protein ArgO